MAKQPSPPSDDYLTHQCNTAGLLLTLYYYLQGSGSCFFLQCPLKKRRVTPQLFAPSTPTGARSAVYVASNPRRMTVLLHKVRVCTVLSLMPLEG